MNLSERGGEEHCAHTNSVKKYTWYAELVEETLQEKYWFHHANINRIPTLSLVSIPSISGSIRPPLMLLLSNIKWLQTPNFKSDSSNTTGCAALCCCQLSFQCEMVPPPHSPPIYHVRCPGWVHQSSTSSHPDLRPFVFIPSPPPVSRLHRGGFLHYSQLHLHSWN